MMSTPRLSILIKDRLRSNSEKGKMRQRTRVGGVRETERVVLVRLCRTRLSFELMTRLANQLGCGVETKTKATQDDATHLCPTLHKYCPDRVPKLLSICSVGDGTC